MTNLLYGKAVADDMTSPLIKRVEGLKKKAVYPCLAVVRVGDKEDDIAYENSIAKRAASVGVDLRREHIAKKYASAQSVLNTIKNLSSDSGVHGILLFRPLPFGIDEARALAAIPPEKDVDGVTQIQRGLLYSTKKYSGAGAAPFFPCAAEAVIRLLDYYGITIAGKRAVVIGRSTVIGKSAAHLLLARDATVTICHRVTSGLSEITRSADIVVSAAGLAREGRERRLDAEYFSHGQIVVDAAVNADENGLYGDIDMDGVNGLVSAITPVPGGLGSVTSLVLMEHIVRAAEEQNADLSAWKE